MNLAGTLRQLGLADEEMRTIERVLAVEPRHLFALLQKATLLESQGKQRAAAKVYHHALQTIPPGASVPGALRGLIDKAVAATKANDAALAAYLNERLQELRGRHAGEEQDRFDHCIDAFLGKRRIFTPEPTFLNFPQLPAPRVLSARAVPLARSAGGRGRGCSRGVRAHVRRGRRQSRAVRFLLDPRCEVAHPAHTGVTNTRVIVHMPLIIPPACRFRVGSTTREWRPAEAWVFDDSIEHEAWNDSDVPLAISCAPP